MDKIKNKKGSVPILVVIFLSILVISVLIPTLYNIQKTANTSKSLKTHINSISNSACIELFNLKDDGTLNYDMEKANETVRICFEHVFEEDLSEIGTFSDTGLLSKTYTNENKTIYIQSIVYNQGMEVKEPQFANINYWIKTDGDKNIDMSEIQNSVAINKPSVIILIKYKMNLMGVDKTIVRYGSSQVNVQP